MTFSLSQPPQEVVFRETSISGLILVRRRGETGLSKIVLFMEGGLFSANVSNFDVSFFEFEENSSFLSF